MLAFSEFFKYLSTREPQAGFHHMLETCWLAEDQKTKYEINVFLCFTLQNQLFLSPLHFNSPFKGKIISRMTWESKISFWLSFSSGTKIHVIHHLESYWNKITNTTSTLWRKCHCLFVFLYFTREDLSISCWLLDWLHWDSLKILKNQQSGTNQTQASISHEPGVLCEVFTQKDVIKSCRN